MVVRGRIQNGVVVLEPGVTVPEGAEVTVDVLPEPESGENDKGTPEFLFRADRLDQRGKTDTALDIVYDQVDEMLLSGRFEDVNDLLRCTKTENHSVHILLALLTITLAAKHKLSERTGFYRRVADTLRRRGALEDGLLIGLD